MSDPVLRAEDVTVVRDGRTVLEDVSLSVRDGDRLLIRGPSGAGKTSLFHVLGLLEPPASGRVVVDGTDAQAGSDATRARLRREAVGVVFQEFRLVPDLTVAENVALPATHAGDPDDEWIEELCERLGIAALADAPPATLSGGEKQRTAIARALANRPRVVLADEPTGQLDPATGEAVVDLLLSAQSLVDGALVVVSHDPAVGDRFDAVRRLEDGQLRESA